MKDSIPCVESDRIKLKGISQPARTFRVAERLDDDSLISISADNTLLQARLSALSQDEALALKQELEQALISVANYLDTAG